MNTLADHFPTGCWHQPDDSYAGECTCGHTFHAGTYVTAKQAWAEHAALKVASDTMREADAEVQRILAMSDDEIIAEATAEDVAWARGFKQGLKAGQSAAALATPQSDGTAIPAGEWWTDAGAVKEARQVFQNGRKALLKEQSINTHLKGVYEPIIAALEPMVSTLAELDSRPLATAPNVASDTVREATNQDTLLDMVGLRLNRALIGPSADVRGHVRIAKELLEAHRAALSVQSPANAGEDGDLLEQAAVIAEAHEPMGFMSDREREYCREHGQEIADRIRIRALNPTKDAQPAPDA